MVRFEVRKSKRLSGKVGIDKEPILPRSRLLLGRKRPYVKESVVVCEDQKGRIIEINFVKKTTSPSETQKRFVVLYFAVIQIAEVQVSMVFDE